MSSAVPLPGDVIAGRYRIEAQIGAGGFGAVYRAMHLGLGRAVALKMLLPEMVSHDQGLSRFRREAELAQRLEHPNTVRLYDFGQSELGLPYIAFELLRGEPLDQAILRGPMPPARVARIAAQVLKSLMEAHALGIVHRDVKPANVFLCEFSGESDFVKVLDFGIAKSSDSRTMLTQAGFSLGTPNYMSPEQVRGEPLSPASDLYSVGLMMAEMLTGRMVFPGSGTDVYREQVSPHPVPLSPAILQSPLHRVLVTATQKDPSRRYWSAGDMLRDLESAMAAPLPVMVPPYAPLPPRPARASSKGPIVIGVAAGTVLVGALALVLLRPSSSVDDTPRKDPDGEDDKPRKKKKKVVEAEPAPPAKPLRRKLEALGWEVISESNTTQPSIHVNTYTAKKGSQMATVYVYESDNTMVLESMEKSLSSQKGSFTKRKGDRFYWIMTFPADATLAEDLLDDLVP